MASNFFYVVETAVVGCFNHGKLLFNVLGIDLITKLETAKGKNEAIQVD